MTTPTSIENAPPRDLPASRWRLEPFRIFFPIGVVLAWIGVGHWVTYAIGVTATYSCQLHSLIQMQGFLMAFAVGFLLTALPRRTQSPPPGRIESAAFAALLLTTAGAALAGLWMAAEIAYAGLFVLLFQFGIRRFLGQTARRNPPAAFVMLPIAAMQGLAGAALIALASVRTTPVWAGPFGQLLVEQGVFLCLVIGMGSLVLPLMGGATPPADLGSSPRESRKAVAYALAGGAIFASLVLEQMGFQRCGPLLRAVVVVAGLAFGAGAWRLPGKPGAHRKLFWMAVWMVPLGLIVSAIWPDYRVPALHILFIGGFSLMAFEAATHVALSHLNMEHLALGRPPVVIIVGATFIVALFARLAADASNTYFIHLGWGAAVWIFGSAVWLAYFAPKMLRP